MECQEKSLFLLRRFWQIKSLLSLSCSVMSDSLRPHGLQHARLFALQHLLGLAQTHVHWVSDAIQPSPSPAFNLSQHQDLFQTISLKKSPVCHDDLCCVSVNSHLFQGGRSYRMFLFPFPIVVTFMRSAGWVTIASVQQGKKSRLTGPGESQDYRAGPRPRPRIVLSTVLDKHGNPLQYSCLEKPTDRGAWRATVHGVTKSRTWLKQLNT